MTPDDKWDALADNSKWGDGHNYGMGIITDNKGGVLSIGESNWNERRFILFYAYEFTARFREASRHDA